MIKSSWSDIDRTAIDFVKSWANETEPRTSRTKVAAALGFTYQAIKKKFNYENAPLTLGEFEKMCNYFNKNSGPFAVWCGWGWLYGDGGQVGLAAGQVDGAADVFLEIEREDSMEW
jgi:hypothetical protein